MASYSLSSSGSYFNNAAVAARAAISAGARRVMILDWSVHHAKGTQDIFMDDPDVLVVSMHRYERWVSMWVEGFYL
jgi:histone deacetylase 6